MAVFNSSSHLIQGMLVAKCSLSMFVNDSISNMQYFILYTCMYMCVCKQISARLYSRCMYVCM